MQIKVALLYFYNINPQILLRWKRKGKLLMSHLPPFVSLLDPLASNVTLVEAIRFGATRFADTIYTHRISAMPQQSGDGIARHGEFNRAFADTLKRAKKKANLEFFPKKKPDMVFLGDVVIYDPFKGQVRFDAALKGRRYKLLHMKGIVNEDGMTLEIYKMGAARKEYCKGQSARVVKPSQAHLFDPEPDTFQMVVDDEEPTRVLIVTQVTGPQKGVLEVWLALPTVDFDADAGTIDVAELCKLFEIPIENNSSGLRVSTKAKDVEHSVNITRKKQTG